MDVTIDLPQELAEEYLAEPEEIRRLAMVDFIKDFIDKRQRERKREERLKNLSPITKEFAGIITQQDIDSITDSRFHYLLNR